MNNLSPPNESTWPIAGGQSSMLASVRHARYMAACRHASMRSAHLAAPCLAAPAACLALPCLALGAPALTLVTPTLLRARLLGALPPALPTATPTLPWRLSLMPCMQHGGAPSDTCDRRVTRVNVGGANVQYKILGSHNVVRAVVEVPELPGLHGQPQ